MLKLEPALVVALCVAGLTACGNDESADHDRTPDIARISEVGAEFGPQYKVTDVAPSGIDPRLFESQPVPPGLEFEPPDCAKFGSGQLVEPGLQGNMAALTAEGDGNRFIAIAVETSDPIPLNVPSDECKEVTFTGPNADGLVQNIDAPQIDDVQTVGSHRTLETRFAGQEPNTGEVYTYVATFDSFLVIVTANPLVLPDQPVTPVDTERAEKLLTDTVSVVRG